MVVVLEVSCFRGGCCFWGIPCRKKEVEKKEKASFCLHFLHLCSFLENKSTIYS